MTTKTEILIGPPGCGKTTSLLNYLDKELEQGTAPDRIAFVSFTRKAATEARDRACERFKLRKSQLPYFRTIHSLCFAALGLSPSDVLQGNKLVEFGDWLGISISSKASAEEGTFGYEVGDRCLQLINTARVRNIPVRQQFDEDCDGLDWHLVDRVERGLEHYKHTRCLHDFNDFLSLFVQADVPTRLDVLFVDEAQDLSALQWAVVAKLARTARRVVVAGDDDQSIYRWSGAAVDHFITMPGQVNVLGQSWRVPQCVQTLAHSVIGQVKQRRPKAWAPRPDMGSICRVQSFEELMFAAGEDVLILARNSKTLRSIAVPNLRMDGVLYDYKGAQSVRPAVLHAILDWETLRRGETITVEAAARMYEFIAVGPNLARGHKKLPGLPQRDTEVTLQDLKDRGGLLTDAIWHDALDMLTAEDRAYMLKCLRRGEKLTRNPTVRLSTIHGSKGGEANHVVLFRDLAYRTYSELRRNPEDEARCFYVAATRARQKLTIIAPSGHLSYDI